MTICILISTVYAQTYCYSMLLSRCNFDRLKALRQPLSPPFPTDFQTAWHDTTPIIDDLHLKNHKRASCALKYNPSKFHEANPEATSANTMVAEQTFSWLAKYKKQINAMNKKNQLFFLQTIVVRTNEYIRQCSLKNKTSLAANGRNDFQRAGN